MAKKVRQQQSLGPKGAKRSSEWSNFGLFGVLAVVMVSFVAYRYRLPKEAVRTPQLPQNSVRCVEHEGALDPLMKGTYGQMMSSAQYHFSKDLAKAFPYMRKMWHLRPDETATAANYVMTLEKMQLIKLGVCVMRTTRSLWPKGNEASLIPFEVLQRLRLLSTLKNTITINGKNYARNAELQSEVRSILDQLDYLARLHPQASSPGLHNTAAFMAGVPIAEFTLAMMRNNLTTAASMLPTVAQNRPHMIAKAGRQVRLRQELHALPVQQWHDLPVPIVLGDVLFSVRRVHKEPSIFVLDHFVSDVEAQQLQQLQRDNMAADLEPPDMCFQKNSYAMSDMASRRLNNIDNLQEDGNGRLCATKSKHPAEWNDMAQQMGYYSRSTIVWGGDSKLVDSLNQRIEELSGLERRFSIYTQLLSYNKTRRNEDGYSAHTDCSTDVNVYPTRAWTFLMYLNTPVSGDPSDGATSFPLLNLSIAPQRGRAVIFESLHNGTGLCDQRSQHIAEKVRGEKFVVQKWFMEAGNYITGDGKAEWLKSDRRQVTCDQTGNGCRTFEALIIGNKQDDIDKKDKEDLAPAP